MVFRTLLTKVLWILSLISLASCALLPPIFLDGRYDSLRSHFSKNNACAHFSECAANVLCADIQNHGFEDRTEPDSNQPA